jgi:cytochrome P450
LAVIAAMGQKGGLDARTVLEAVHEALSDMDNPRHAQYTDGLLQVLTGKALEEWERIVAVSTHEYQSDFAKRMIAEGEAKMLITVLTARGIEVTAEARDRIERCTDRDQFELWATRAATCQNADDLFD